MGRFTLRDEGKTIAVGKVLKYKPYSKGIVGAAKSTTSATQQVTKQLASTVITQSKAVEELVYDGETGETRPKKQAMPAIVEGEEEDD